MSNNYDSIEEKFLNRNDIFVLQFRKGLVFLEVLTREITKYKPYSNLEDIESGTSLDGGYTRLEDPASSNDILTPDDGDEDKVIHASIGHKPWFIRRYTKFPEGAGNLGKVSNLTFPRPSDGDDYGYVDGKDSPYDEPSAARELMVPYNVNVGFNFYNPDDDDHEPILNVKMATYEVSGLNPNNSDHQNAVRRALSPGSPIPTYVVGTPGNEAEANSDVKRAYGVRPVSREKAKNIVGM
jgi:hypothetical protein